MHRRCCSRSLCACACWCLLRDTNKHTSLRKGVPSARTLQQACRGTSLIRKCPPLRLYSRPMPRVLRVSLGGGRFLMGEVALYAYSPTGTRHLAVSEEPL